MTKRQIRLNEQAKNIIRYGRIIMDEEQEKDGHFYRTRMVMLGTITYMVVMKDGNATIVSEALN